MINDHDISGNSIDNASDMGEEHFPVEPHYHPVNRSIRSIYNVFASAKLAMFLLVAILACCLVGVTILRDESANRLIFGTLWFNGLLVLLVVNVACCFFGRIWGRRLTLISIGMILFHLSFVTMFVGIVYNSLYYFRGVIRLTEGETLLNRDPGSYDMKERGRFFRYSRLKGSTTLNKVHVGYVIEGKDKRLAYDVAIGDQGRQKQGIIYITHHFDYDGFKYFREKEGFSVLTVLRDKLGEELYGAYIPLQTLKQNDNSFHITSGTKDGPAAFLFPQKPDVPRLNVQLSYRPERTNERTGEVSFKVAPYKNMDVTVEKDTDVITGTIPVGKIFNAGQYDLSVKEIRYWAAMRVNYEPGQPLILGSLWVGLAGIILTTGARILKQKKKVS